MEIPSELHYIPISCISFSGVPVVRKPVDYTKKLPTDGRPLYLDAQATTPMVKC
jgi:hypothetical protein